MSLLEQNLVSFIEKGIGKNENQETKLTKDEIRRARDVINRMHPLKNVPLKQSLHFLAFLSCKKCFKKVYSEEKKSLTSNDQLKED